MKLNTNILKTKLNEFFRLFKHRHRLVILDSDTFQERWSFKLSAMNVFIALGILSIVLVVVTSIIIAFTGLRQYIPGYMRDDLIEEAHNNRLKLDSLQRLYADQTLMLNNIKMVISGQDIPTVDFKTPKVDDTSKNYYKNIEYQRSKEDSLLRVEQEQSDDNPKSKYDIKKRATTEQEKPFSVSDNTLKNYFFYTPIKGTIVNGYDLSKRHLGIDIAAKPNEPVKAIYGGTVIFADWTVDGGYTIAVQHPQNIISVYKHNSSLLKRESDIVRAGEPIAFIGNSGEQTSGQHLHFELWHNGSSVNPREYIPF